MLLRIDLRHTLATQIARLVPTQKPALCEAKDTTSYPQDLYESIALGNAMADIEDEANRAWRGR